MRLPLLVYVVGVPIAVLLFCAMVGSIFLPNSALFSSSNTAETWRVCQVATENYPPGRAYAKTYEGNCRNGVLREFYVTNDYGQNWTLLSPDEVQSMNWGIFDRIPKTYLYQEHDQLTTEQGNVVWTFPRSIFRWLFTSSDVPVKNLLTSVSASEDAIYLALDSYGVLVGPYPFDSKTRTWQITNQGINGLNQPELRFTNPVAIALITLLALFIPPITWIHGWLIGQVWRYMYSEAEENRALAERVRVARILTFFAALACIFWLTNTSVDFYQIVGALAVLSVVISVYEGVQLARQQDFSAAFIMRLGIATGLLALIVPLGIALTPIGLGWFIILFILIAFIANRRAFVSYLEYEHIHVTRWKIDRVSLEILVVIALTLFLFPLFSAVYFLAILFLPFGIYIINANYIIIRTGFITPKKYKEDEKAELKEHQDSWRGSFFGATIGWMVGGTVISGTILVLQAIVFGWFNTLGGHF